MFMDNPIKQQYLKMFLSQIHTKKMQNKEQAINNEPY